MIKTKFTAEITETSMPGFSILTLKKDGDNEFVLTFYQTVPNEVADWIKSLLNVEECFADHLRSHGTQI